MAIRLMIVRDEATARLLSMLRDRILPAQVFAEQIPQYPALALLLSELLQQTEVALAESSPTDPGDVLETKG